MIKAFISHSSKQKPFVEELTQRLGKNFCMVDCYSFEAARKTIKEIYDSIDKSTVFVLLISRESLASDWVTKEIDYAKNKLSADDFERFWPYIIDETLEIEDCPEWIRETDCFNLKKFKSPQILARDIEQKFRKIIWAKDKTRKLLETTVVGRNADIAKFEEKYQSLRGLSLCALVVSGRDGVGKEAFAKACMHKVGYDIETEPYHICMNPNEGIENFLLYLNMITRKYCQEEIENILAQEVEVKVDRAVELLNELYETRSVVFINDDLSCILPYRKMADWLIDVIESSKLSNQLGLYINTRKVPDTFLETEHPRIAQIQLQPLDRRDRTMLFVNCMRAYNLTDLREEDINFFVDKLLQSPEQIVKVAEALTRTPIHTVKRDIASLQQIGDKKIEPLKNRFFQDEEKKCLLIILSKLDFISYKILERIYEERIIEAMEIIEEMMDYGIVSTFGPNDDFFRLDHYFSDYIKRCHLKLAPDWEMHVNDVLEDMITNSNDINEDVSIYLYDARERIMKGKGDKTSFLIPSVVVSSVIEVYNKQDYNLVIKICDSVLNDSHNYYPDQERELRYWLCLALARKTDTRFFDEVQKMQGSDYCFLRGFYQRIATVYAEAERWYKKALEKSPNLQRAKRELVTALLAQKKFPEALGMAKENYEHDPDNSYQIHGYFRCLVRKHGLTREEIKTLEELLNSMRDNLSDKHNELYTAMNIEYQDNVKRKDPTYMLQLIADAESKYPTSLNVQRAAHAYRYKQQIITVDKTFSEDIE